MNNMDEKKYMINNKPASANDIITMARKCNPSYDKLEVYTTSAGAQRLRDIGLTVGDNPNYKKEIDHNIHLRQETNLLKAFDLFIKKWCGDYYAHLSDSDKNDGQHIRSLIEQQTK